MTVMPAPSQHQWYLARDGQQYGPLSDPELAKFIELGHLQPNDLLWRDGFPEWRPAMVVFPTPSQTTPRPTTAAKPRGRSAPASEASNRNPGRAQPAGHRQDDRGERRTRRGSR